jgi:hypothetical protein
MLVSVPAAHASTCTPTGGQPGFSGFYYALEKDTDTATIYGGGTYASPYAWTLNTAGTSDHMALWLSFVYGNKLWAQTGWAIGNIDGYVLTSARFPYAEIKIYSGTFAYGWTSYTIPDNDQGYFEAWSYSYDGLTYTVHTIVYSPHWGAAFLYTYNTGGFGTGTLDEGTEASYASTPPTCDLYAYYSGNGGAVYSTSYGTSEPLTLGIGTSWTSCATEFQNFPYNVALNVGSCSGVVQFWGG